MNTPWLSLAHLYTTTEVPFWSEHHKATEISSYLWQAKRNLPEFCLILLTDVARWHMQGFFPSNVFFTTYATTTLCLQMKHCKLDDVQNISVHSGSAQI